MPVAIGPPARTGADLARTITTACDLGP
jgi:hypothetical protein